MIILYEDFGTDLLNLSKTLINSDCYQVQSQAVKLLVKLLRYGNSKIRNEVLIFSESLISSTNFFIRRLYFIFFEDAIIILSTNFIFENRIIDNVFKFLNDSCYLNIIRFFKFIPKFYYILSSEVKLKFLINSKMDMIRKSKPKDNELLLVMLFLIKVY